MLLTPGTRLGPYTINTLIGSGGIGEVYKAHDERLNRTVAIKRMIADDVSRFQSEALEPLLSPWTHTLLLRFLQRQHLKRR